MKEKLTKLYNFSNSWTGTIIIVLLVIFFVAQAFVIPSGSMKNTLLIGDHLFVKKFSYGVPIPHIPWLEVPVLPDFKGNGHLIDADGPKREDIVVFRYPGNHKIHYVKRCVAVGGDEILYTQKAFYLHPHEGNDFANKNYPKAKKITYNSKVWIKNPYMSKYPGIHYTKSSFGDEKFPEQLWNISLGYFNKNQRELNTDELKNAFIKTAMFLKSQNVSFPPYPKAITPIKVTHEDFNQNMTYQGLQLPFNALYKKVPKDEYFMMGDNRNNSEDSRFWGSVPYSLIVGKPWFIYFSWNSGDNLPNDKNKYIIRWNRIGRFVSTVQTDKNFINGK